MLVQNYAIYLPKSSPLHRPKGQVLDAHLKVAAQAHALLVGCLAMMAIEYETYQMPVRETIALKYHISGSINLRKSNVMGTTTNAAGSIPKLWRIIRVIGTGPDPFTMALEASSRR